MSDGLVPFSARLDLRRVAEVALFLKRVDQQPSDKSRLLRRGIETLAAAAKKDNHIREIDTNEEALEVLEEMSITFKQNKQATEDVAEALSSDSLTDGAEEEEAIVEDILSGEAEDPGDQDLPS